MNALWACINNTEYEASLDVGKVYQGILDLTGAEKAMIRVLDEDVPGPRGVTCKQDPPRKPSP